MKTFTRLFLSLCGVFIICTSCTNKAEEPSTRVEKDSEVFSQYVDLTEKPMISALDIALRKTTLPEDADCLIGFTDEDVRFLCSLNASELAKVKAEIMHQWDIATDEECDSIIDSYYAKMCEGMNDQELIKFNRFIDEYIEMPIGKESLQQFDAFKNSATSTAVNIKYAYAAFGIDCFGRKLYETLSPATRSAAYCKKIFGIRIAITSVSMICGWLLPGPGWAVAAIATCDALGASADYFNCLRTRAE